MERRLPLRRDQHRKLAATLFNDVWRLLEKKGRSHGDDLRMIHEAHASRYHWGRVGTPANLAIGEWQVSRVYAVLKRPEPALYHAKRCLEVCEANDVHDFPLAYAYEALARASALARRTADRDRYLRRAQAIGRSIREADERDQFFRDLASVSRR